MRTLATETSIKLRSQCPFLMDSPLIYLVEKYYLPKKILLTTSTGKA
uniref:Uncharacterized protein n=1 Tax=Rhizophora mucronata TaxID=61149 RepID=A0A2P2KNT1_RHIMU